NRGFFYSSASSAFEETDKKASVKYKVKVPEPYRMASYQLDSLPASIEGNMQQIVSESPFREDMRFDLGNMKLERNRIDIEIKKKCYCNLNYKFLLFEVDANICKKRRFDLFLKFQNEVPDKRLIPYKIPKINIYPNYELSDSTTVE